MITTARIADSQHQTNHVVESTDIVNSDPLQSGFTHGTKTLRRQRGPWRTREAPTTVPVTMDAFIQAFEEARARLISIRGRNVSVRELIREAGFDDSRRPGVAYHLNPNRHTGERPHRVPVEVIQKLAAVLPISEEELSRAAAVASGLNVVDRDVLDSDVTYVVARFFGDERVGEDEMEAAKSRILQIIASQTAQRRRSVDDAEGSERQLGDGHPDEGGEGTVSAS